MVDFDKRLVEVDEVLNYLSNEELKKIPENVRKAIKINKSTKYTWKYDEEKSLKDQNLPRDTIVLLAYLNSEYILNKEQKEFMEKVYLENEKKHEKIKEQPLNYKSLFEEKNIEKSKEQNENTSNYEVALTENKNSIFKTIRNFIFKIFHKNKF